MTGYYSQSCDTQLRASLGRSEETRNFVDDRNFAFSSNQPPRSRASVRRWEETRNFVDDRSFAFGSNRPPQSRTSLERSQETRNIVHDRSFAFSNNQPPRSGASVVWSEQTHNFVDDRNFAFNSSQPPQSRASVGRCEETPNFVDDRSFAFSSNQPLQSRASFGMSEETCSIGHDRSFAFSNNQPPQTRVPLGMSEETGNIVHDRSLAFSSNQPPQSRVSLGMSDETHNLVDDRNFAFNNKQPSQSWSSTKMGEETHNLVDDRSFAFSNKHPPRSWAPSRMSGETANLVDDRSFASNSKQPSRSWSPSGMSEETRNLVANRITFRSNRPRKRVIRDSGFRTASQKRNIRRNRKREERRNALKKSADITASTAEEKDGSSPKMLHSGMSEETHNLVADRGFAFSSNQSPEPVIKDQGFLSNTQKRRIRKRQRQEFKRLTGIAASTAEEKDGSSWKQLCSPSTPSFTSQDEIMNTRHNLPSNLFAEDSKITKKDIITERLPAHELYHPSWTRKVHEDLPSKSFAQSLKLTKLAIINEGFPITRVLSKDEGDLIQMEILRRIDVIPSGSLLPKIRGSNFLDDGTIVLLCEDENTVSWLKDQFDKEDKLIKGATLKVVNLTSLSKPVKVAFKTRDVLTKEPAVLLRRLQRFNPELESEKWHFLEISMEPSTTRWIFELNQNALKAIKKAEFGAFTGLDRGKFKVLNDSLNEVPTHQK